MHLFLRGFDAALAPFTRLGHGVAWAFDGRPGAFQAAIAAIALLVLALAIAPAGGAGVGLETIAAARLAVGVIGFALFIGLARASFDADSAVEAAMSGLSAEAGRARADAQPLLAPHAPLLLCLLAFAAFLSAASGLLGLGLGMRATRYGAETAALTPLEWLQTGLWATVGLIDVVGRAPDARAPAAGLSIAWGPALAWLALYKAALALFVLARLALVLDKRRVARLGLAPEAPEEARAAHFARLGAVGAATLIGALRSGAAGGRADAARLIGRLGGQAAFYDPRAGAASLTRALGDRAPEVRAAAAQALGAFGAAAQGAGPALAQALEDADDRVQLAAAAALGRIGAQDRAVVRALIAALDGAGRGAVTAVLDSLTTLAVGDAEAIERVDKLRSHGDDEVRRKVTDTLTILRGGRAMAA